MNKEGAPKSELYDKIVKHIESYSGVHVLHSQIFPSRKYIQMGNEEVMVRNLGEILIMYEEKDTSKKDLLKEVAVSIKRDRDLKALINEVEVKDEENPEKTWLEHRAKTQEYFQTEEGKLEKTDDTKYTGDFIIYDSRPKSVKLAKSKKEIKFIDRIKITEWMYH